MRGFILIVISLLYQQVVAQPEYRKATVVTITDDIIPYTLKYSNPWRPVPKGSKEALQGIKAYTFDNGREFVFKEVKSDSSLYVETLLIGKISLYRFKNQYLVQNDTMSRPRSLNAKNEVSYKGSQKVKTESQRHVGILRFMTRDCPMLAEVVGSVRLSKKSLLEFLGKYHDCQGASYEVIKDNTRPLKLSINPFYSVVWSNMEVDGDDIITGMSNFDNISSGGFGIFFDLGLPRLSNRFFLNLGVQSMNEKSYVGIYDNRSTFLFLNYRTTIETRETLWNLGLKYQTPYKTVAPYGGFGVTHGNITTNGSDQSQSILNTTSNETRVEEIPDVFRINEGLSGHYFFIGSNVRITNRLQGHIELRRNTLNGEGVETGESQTDLQIKMTQLRFGLTIRLTEN